MLSNDNIVFFQEQGGREYMEDRINIFQLPDGYECYAVFDGHGGSVVVEFVTRHLKETLMSLILAKTRMNIDEDEILYQTIKDLTEQLPMPHAKTQGTTALIVLKQGNKMWVAHCGDSRAIITLENGNSIQVTYDHKPNRDDEYRRINASGGFVAPAYKGDVYRVNGSLAVSRSIGDLDLFPYVTWKPEISYVSITSKFSFLVLCTDGIWDVMSNDDISTILSKNSLFSNINIAQAICTLAKNRGSTDNMSIVIVRL